MVKQRSACKEDEELNPETKRCRKKCREDQERNKETGRCRKTTVKLKKSKVVVKKAPKVSEEKRVKRSSSSTRPPCKAEVDEIKRLIQNEKVLREKLSYFENEAKKCQREMSGVVIIDGPISLSEHYSEALNKHIYIFGDEHVNTEEACKSEKVAIPIDKFIEKTLDQNKDKTIDFFIELPYRKIRTERKTADYGKYNGKMSYLSLLNNTFLDCLNKTPQCKYKNLRIHYTDTRQGESLFTNLGDLHKIATSIKYLRETDRLSSDTVDTLDSYKKYFDYIYWDNFRKDPFINFKGFKQLNNIKNPEIKAILSNRYLDKVNDYITAFYYVAQNIEEFKNIGKERINSERVKMLFSVFDKLEIAQVSLMDVYLLGRVFREFKTGENPDNVIIYVGDYHAKEYREVLNSLGFKKIREVSNDSIYSKDTSQCLDISQFKLPFFS